MPVPTYDQFIEPILRYLATKPDGAPAHDVHDAAAVALGLSDSDRAELLPSDTQTVYKNRAGWAHDRLKRSGLSSHLRRGFWRLTDAGREFAASNPGPLPDEIVERLAADKTDVRLRTAESPPQTAIMPPIEAARTVSPDDRLEVALADLRERLLQSFSKPCLK